MSDKRIIDLEESTKIESGDYLAIDSNSGGTCKANAGIITNQFADMQEVLGSKNLCPNEATSQVVSGVTFTVNSDGSVKANGTASAGINFVLKSAFTLPKGDYILTDGVKNQYSYASIKEGAIVIARGRDDGAFTLAADTEVLAEIWITSGQTLSNVTFYPMVRPANIPDTTYVPFAKSNKELTDDVASINSALIHPIDVSNVITTLTAKNQSYTMQSDGWVTGTMASEPGHSGQVIINDVTAAYAISSDSARAVTIGVYLPVKKGDVVKTFSGYGSYNLTIYGVK